VAEPEHWSRLDLELPLPFADWVSAELLGWGCVGIELGDLPDASRVRLSAFFLDVDARSGYRKLNHFMDALGEQALPWELSPPEPVAPVDWANEWRHHFPPMEVGRRLVIVPPWDAEAVGRDRLPIVLQPGMAFGTGRHPSTTLVLEALEQVADLDQLGTVLDIGCGSGILSIGAVRLGAQHVLAIDYDAEAVRSARENIDRNGLSDRITVAGQRFPDLGDHGPFRLVMANVYFTFFEQQLPDLVGLVAEGGRLLASGLEGEEGGRVAERLRAAGLEAEVSQSRQGWSLVEAERL